MTGVHRDTIMCLGVRVGKGCQNLLNEKRHDLPFSVSWKRDAANANAFVADVASRMKNRVQISSDALGAYVEAIEQAFGGSVDFAQIIKTYMHDEVPGRCYSAP
jgi:hypothetical protein